MVPFDFEAGEDREATPEEIRHWQEVQEMRHRLITGVAAGKCRICEHDFTQSNPHSGGGVCQECWEKSRKAV
jgi:hypothetical protein